MCTKFFPVARNEGKKIRGREGRIFAHGKAYFSSKVMPDTFLMLSAPVINNKTGMKQIGYRGINPCSCQIHPNGNIIIWPHTTGWKEWLISQFVNYGLPQNVSKFIVEHAKIEFCTLEAGVKPLDASFLPQDFHIHADWGLTIVRDNTPEKGVLEVKFDIPNMQHFLGLPEIKKRLEVIEQGSVTLNQSYRTIVALLLKLNEHWEKELQFQEKTKGDHN